MSYKSLRRAKRERQRRNQVIMWYIKDIAALACLLATFYILWVLAYALS